MLWIYRKVGLQKTHFSCGMILKSTCPVAFILLQLCLAQQNQLLETLGHSILELESCHPQVRWNGIQRMNKSILDGTKWIMDHIRHGITGWNYMKSTPFPNTLPCDVDNFPHYRTRSKEVQASFTEIRDVYRYGWINNKSYKRNMYDISLFHPFDAVWTLWKPLVHPSRFLFWVNPQRMVSLLDP